MVDRVPAVLSPADREAMEHIAPFRITVEGTNVVMLLGQLQLALRHPANLDPHCWPAMLTRALAQALEAHAGITPGIRAFLKAGWTEVTW